MPLLGARGSDSSADRTIEGVNHETSTPVDQTPAVEFEDVSFAFDDHVVLKNISFSVPVGGMTVLLGKSGVGKSVILKLILGLLRPDSGRISVNGQRIDHLPERELLQIRTDIGIAFQENALFDSLTVNENVGFRLYEETRMPVADVRKRVDEVLGFVGLADFADRMPSELSGGQRRRVSIARAMATKPRLLLLDDPTTGLDPIVAATVDDEIVKLRDLEQLTFIFVTQQIRDAFYVAEHRAVRKAGGVEIVDARETGALPATFILFRDAQIHFQGSGAELLASDDAYLKEFLDMTLPPWGETPKQSRRAASEPTTR